MINSKKDKKKDYNRNIKSVAGRLKRRISRNSDFREF